MSLQALGYRPGAAFPQNNRNGGVIDQNSPRTSVVNGNGNQVDQSINNNTVNNITINYNNEAGREAPCDCEEAKPVRAKAKVRAKERQG